MTIDEAIPVGVISPTRVGVFEPSGTGAFFLTVTAFVAVGICPGWDLSTISSHAQVLPVDETQRFGAIHGYGVEDGVDALFEVGEAQLVGVLLDVVGQLLDDALMLGGVGVLVLGLPVGVLVFGAGSAQMVLGLETSDSSFEVEERTYPGHVLGVKAREDGVVRDRAHLVHPPIDGVHLTGFHQRKRARHILGGDSGASSGGAIVGGDHRSHRRDI